VDQRDDPRMRDRHVDDTTDTDEGETHASTGGAVVAGAATGGLIGGMGAGPIGAAVGAVGGAIVGAISERVMHSDDDHEHTGMDDGHDHDEHDAHMTRSRTGTPDTGHTHDTTGNTMQLREEELVAQKRMVESGRVEVEKDVVTERRSLEVPVTREEVVVERHAVERRPSDRPISETGAIEVPVREEQVSVEKRPVVYEEVEIGKRATQETRHVEGEVRREVADVHTDRDLDVREGGSTGTTDTRPRI